MVWSGLESSRALRDTWSSVEAITSNEFLRHFQMPRLCGLGHGRLPRGDSIEGCCGQGEAEPGRGWETCA